LRVKFLSASCTTIDYEILLLRIFPRTKGTIRILGWIRTSLVEKVS